MILYSTLITSEEILDWVVHQHIRTALVEEAYGRWLEEDEEAAQFYADTWTGYVAQARHGYYVWLEGDEITVNLLPDMLKRCRVLVEELRSVSQEMNNLSMQAWTHISILDERASITQEALADELIALLVDAKLVEPLI